MSLNCLACRAEIHRDFKACPKCGDIITDFLREHLDKPIDGKYQILERIGAGGMGEVYKTLHIHLDSLRVVKVMRPSIQDALDAQERFNREAKLATKIHHPNVATLHDFSILADGTKYMVWEYIYGKSLAAVIQARGPLSPRHACSIAIQVLQGLDAIHRAGIIHRDISPDNIMLTRDDERRERAKIIDLGIAKSGVPAGDADQTRAGVFVGKWRYASPEQVGALSEGETIDGRADLYSFGIVMYEMLTGTPPFVADGPHQYILQQTTEAPRPMQIAKPDLDVPPQLESLVRGALEKDRKNRFQNAREFIAELERVLPTLDDTIVGKHRRELGIPPTTPVPQTPRPAPIPEEQQTLLTPPPVATVVTPASPKAESPMRPMSRMWIAFGASVAAIALIAAGVVAGRMLSREEPPAPVTTPPVAQMKVAQVPPPPVVDITATETAAVATTMPTETVAEKAVEQPKKAVETTKPVVAEEEKRSVVPSALPPDPPKRSLFGRREKLFTETAEYKRGFIHGIIKDYESLERADEVHWAKIAHGTKLAGQKIAFSKFTNLSARNDPAMLAALNESLVKKVDGATLRAQGAVIWAETDPSKPQGVAVEILVRDAKGEIVVSLRHVERESTAVASAREVAAAVSDFLNSN